MHAIAESIMERVCPRLSPGASLLIARHDQILLQRGFGWADLDKQAARADSSYLIASVTKQFVCAAALLLVQDGVLDLDLPLARYAPRLPPYKDQVTLRHLMTHTSGISDYFNSDFIAKYCQDDSPELDQDGLVDYITRNLARLEFAPGSSWAYSNSGYILLGWIIERLSGMPLAELLAQRVFEPLGMRNTLMGTSDRRPAGMALGYERQKDASYSAAPYNRTVVGWADGNIISTCSDLYKWQTAWQAGKLLDPGLWRQAFTPYELSDGRSSHYGLGWFLWNRRGLEERWHTGGTVGYRCRAACFPQEGLSIIMLLNAGSEGAGDINQPFGRLVQEALGRSLRPLPAWSAVPAADLPAWTGTWQSTEKDPANRRRFSIQADAQRRLSLRTANGVATGAGGGGGGGGPRARRGRNSPSCPRARICCGLIPGWTII